MTRDTDVLVPPGVPVALTIKQAAAVCGLDERQLMRWCRNGFVYALQSTAGGRFWIPRAEVERVAGLLMTDPEWTHAL